MEENFHLIGNLDLIGHVIWNCKIRSLNVGPTLSFRLETSVIDVQAFCNELKSILKDFPIMSSTD
jgi:hypothetical protein